MGERSKAEIAAAMTAVVFGMSILAIMIAIITDSEALVVLGVLAGTVGASFPISKWIVGEEEETQQTTKASYGQAPLIGVGAGDDRKKTDAEYIDMMKNNVNWQNRGK